MNNFLELWETFSNTLFPGYFHFFYTFIIRKKKTEQRSHTNSVNIKTFKGKIKENKTMLTANSFN